MLIIVTPPPPHVHGRLAKGDPSCCLPIVSYALTSFSPAVAEHLVELGIELTGKNDLSFTESVYKVSHMFVHPYT